MKSNYSEEGNCFYQHSERTLKVKDRIPTGVYVIKFNPDRGAFYLEMADPFEVPSKLYGTVHKDTNRILTTFQDRSAATGVMLSGDAGSGKTMLAKNLSHMALMLDIPTILVNTPFKGPAFNSFIAGIEQDAVVIFDEFEKVYDEEDQEAILTLLDGTVKTKKLFVFTCNDKWRVNAHMKNRPGRIYYMKEYKGLDEKFIREYCNDNLLENLKVHIDAICQFAETFRSFNFDILKATVEEMNRYNEGPKDAIEMLNARPGYDKNDVKYDLVVQLPDGSKQALKQTWSGAPLVDDHLTINVRLWYKMDENGSHLGLAENREGVVQATQCQLNEVTYDHFSWEADGLRGMQPDKSILFENEDGWRLYLRKAKVVEGPGVSVLF